MLRQEINVPLGQDWEKEMRKFTKDELIGMLRAELKVKTISTIVDAQNFVEGTLNDFESGLSTKAETLSAFGKFTGRLMEVFWIEAKKRIKANPKLLES